MSVAAGPGRLGRDRRHCAGVAEGAAWTGRALGELVHAGPIVAAAGGSASVARVDGDGAPRPARAAGRAAG